MSAENCIDTTRCPCPCLPKVTLEQAVVDLVESIALQENALSHILCAESRKMDAAMKLDGLDLCKLLGCKAVIPMHWGTFPVLAQNTAAFKEALQKQHLSCTCVDMGVGETVSFG